MCYPSLACYGSCLLLSRSLFLWLLFDFSANPDGRRVRVLRLHQRRDQGLADIRKVFYGAEVSLRSSLGRPDQVDRVAVGARGPRDGRLALPPDAELPFRADSKGM